MDKYLIKYLRDNASNELSRKYIDFFKIELDWHIYNAERHISHSYYRDRKISTKEKLYSILQYQNSLFDSFINKSDHSPKVLSTVYFPVNNALNELGFKVMSPVWRSVGRKNIFGDHQVILWHRKIQNLIRHREFHSFLDIELHVELENFQQHLFNKYENANFRALFLYTDQFFYSKYNIDIFKKLNKPSFIFSHGLPGIYSKEVDHRSDYLLVWGEKIRENYLSAGFSADKVKVVGHPKYKKPSSANTLRSELSDVLVVPVSSVLYHQHEYDQTILMDKSMVILYLYQVQDVLTKLGVKKARYRVHPSLNKAWIKSFLDQKFYILDEEPLESSLSKTSLVIGATSTLFLESLIYGVNYIVFEPKDEEGMNMLNTTLVPPFDGSDPKVMVAHHASELSQMIKENVMNDFSIVRDYIQPFDISCLKDLIH